MELFQLEYFLALAKYQHFGKTSEAISISISALSTGIKNLERDLGTTLFIRGQHATILSPSGERFLPLAARIMEDVHRAESEMQAYRKEAQETLRVGTLLANNYSATFPLIIAFQKAYPDYKLELNVDTTENLMKSLLAGGLDVAFQSFGKLPSDNKIDYLHLWDTPLALLVPRTNELSRQGSVSLESVCGQKLFIEGEHKPLFEDLCAQNGLTPRFELVSNSVPLIRSCVSDGGGCAIVAKTVARNMEDAASVTVDFFPTVHRKIYLTALKSAPRSLAFDAFHSFCAAMVSGGPETIRLPALS